MYTDPTLADHELGWDDAIQRDSQYVMVPPGDYNFRVLKVERGRHPGSDNLPPCNKAELTLEVSNGTDKTMMTANLYLHTKTEGILCAFFTAIGQRKRGESLKPRWNEVVGSTGTCKLGVNSYTGKQDGKKHESMQVDKWYEKGHLIDAGGSAAQNAANAYGGMAQSTASSYGAPAQGWQPQLGTTTPGVPQAPAQGWPQQPAQQTGWNQSTPQPAALSWQQPASQPAPAAAPPLPQTGWTPGAF